MTEYFARKEYVYTGGDAIFSIPFSYIDKKHIKVYINEVKYTGFTYLNDTQIRIYQTLKIGDVVVVSRETPIDEKFVTFTDTSILSQKQQNLAQDQVFDAMQEVSDRNTKFIIDAKTQAEETAEKFQGQINTFKEDVNTELSVMDGRVTTNAENIQKHVDDVNNALYTAENSIKNMSDAVIMAKNDALTAIGQNNSSGARGSAITAINQQKQASVSSVSSVSNSAINTISRMQSEINQSKENAKDFYQKAVGWNINYETDGEEDCLVFEDRTDEEINQAKNYIEDTRDKALASIEEAKTSALNSVESTRASVVSSVTTAGNSAISNINSAKTSATQEISSTKNDVVSSVTTAGTNALNSINSAKTSAINEVNNAKTTTIDNAKNSAISSINTAKTEAVNTIYSTKTSAVNACAEQVALAKEYAQMANGWNFSYQDETLIFTRNEV